MLPPLPLQDQVALITGARRGIGRAIALRLAAGGARCVLLARHAPDEVAAEILAAGGEALALEGDVADGDRAAAVVQQAVKHFGRLDVLVNNAGIADDSLLVRMKPEQWQRVLDVNLTGAYNFSRPAARVMLKAESGRIINITSVIGQMGNPGQANYAAAKAGLIGFTRALARELGSRGITVNAVAPGFITTDMTAAMSEEAVTSLLASIPLGKLGQVEDVAGMVSFLAGPEARYITGQVLNVDGGLVM